MKKFTLLLVILSSFFLEQSFAQTGPGGLGGTTLKTWVRADRGVTITGSEVTAWADQSGNGNNFTGTIGQSPTFVSSVAITTNPVPPVTKNRPVIRFNAGGTRQLRGPSAATTFGLPGSASFTGDVFVVYLNAASDNYGNIIFYPRGSNDNNAFLTLINNKTDVNTNPGGNSPNNLKTAISQSGTTNWGTAFSATPGLLNNNFTATNYHVARTGFNQTSVWLYNDSTLAQKSTGLTPDYNFNNAEPTSAGQNAMRMGRGNTQFTGDIAEFFVFNKELDSTEYRILQNYFNERYGFAIQNDRFIGATGYDNDLVGIGKQGANPKVAATVGSSAGLLLDETGGSIADDEWVFAAHDNGAIDLTTTDALATESRVTRIWRIEKTGAVDTRLIFDLSTLGLPTLPATNFRLLKRTGTSGAFADVPPTSATIVGNTIEFVVPDASLVSGEYYTLGVQDIPTTWYVFQSGNWDTATNWTTDAAVNPIQIPTGGGVPGPIDEVFIRGGKSITITTNNKQLKSIRVAGTLDYGATTGHNFAIINGRGTIRSSGTTSNFPTGITTGSIGFGDKTNGGTFEIYGNANTEINQNLIIKNLLINKSTDSEIVTLAGNVTLTQNFEVSVGNFRFGNDATTRTLLVENNVNIRTNGRISVLNVVNNARHRFEIKGDFINDGTVRMSNRTDFADDTDRFNSNFSYYSSEANNGIVDVFLTSGDRNQNIAANGSTFFYRVVTQKGLDPTYEAIFTATSQSNFALLGAANTNVNSDITLATQNNNAFALISGTARIGNNVRIPVLNRVTNYSIASAARLLIDGGYVRKVAGQAIVPYGTVEINSGTLISDVPSGITLRDAGSFIANGGTTTLRALRTSVNGITAQGTFEMTGGTVLIDGNSTINNDYSLLALNYPGNVFKMSGGTLTIRNAPSLGTDNLRGAVFINCDPQNIALKGGTVIFESNRNTHEYRVTSRAPFYNVIMRYTGTGTGGNIVLSGTTSGPASPAGAQVTLSAQPLTVLNDFTIETGNTRTSGSDTYGTYFDLCPGGNCVDITVGGNFTLNDNTVFDSWSGAANNANSSTVTFDGQRNSTLYVGDITTYTVALTGYIDPETEETFGRWELPFYSMLIDKPGFTLSLSAKNPGRSGNPTTTLSSFKTGAGGKNIQNWGSNLIKILNVFSLSENSTLDQIDPNASTVGYSLRLYGADITNNGTLFTYEEGVTPLDGIVKTRKGAGDFTINTIANSEFGNLRLNSDADIVSFTSDTYIKRLEFRHGRFNIGTFNLKIDKLDINLEGGDVDTRDGSTYMFSAQDMIYTAGNASDGGLSLKVQRAGFVSWDAYANANDEYIDKDNNPPRWLWFPIGTSKNGLRYTPAICYIKTPGTYTGDEYITVRPVDGELQTTALGSGDILSYYWNVDFEGFAAGEEPKVSWLFQYAESDKDAGNEADYVPGKVLNGGTYQRSDEGGVNAVKHGGGSFNVFGDNNNGDILGDDPANIIIFNGIGSSTAPADANNDIDTDTADEVIRESGTTQVDDNWDHALSLPVGLTLERANYTAGVPARFVGNPEIYYNTEYGSPYNNFGKWDDHRKWSKIDHFTDDGNSGYPQIGDIVILSRPDTDGGGNFGNANTYDHYVEINADAECAAIVFTNTPTGTGSSSVASPRLIVNLNVTANLGVVSGSNGAIGYNIDNSTNNPVVSGDFGQFNADLSNQVLFFPRNTAGAQPVSTAIPSLTEFPNLRIHGDGGGAWRYVTFKDDIIVNGNCRVDVSSGLILDDGSNGDIKVAGTLQIGPDNRGGRVIYQASGTARTLEVGGIYINPGSESNYLRVESGGAVSTRHTLILNGDVYIGNGADDYIDLFTNGTGGANVDLILKTAGDGDYWDTDNTSALDQLYTITVNKGVSIDNYFYFFSDLDIPLPSTIGQKPIDILNGTLVLQNAGLTVTLTDEARGNFNLPNLSNSAASSGSGGLEVKLGNVRVEGNNIGIILDGLLRVSGGTLDMNTGVGNGNNFIEYSASGNAVIEVSAGTLITGSNIRRSLTSLEGVLKYRQTGGTALIGQGGNPSTIRGMFEVDNAGSEFTLTGGTFVVRRGINSTSVPSVTLRPETSTITRPIYLGSTGASGFGVATPSGQTNFGFLSNVPLRKLVVNGSNAPTIKLYSEVLTSDSLTIGTGNTFQPQIYDVAINRNLTNDGIYTVGTVDQTTIFSSALRSTILGSGTTNFWNFRKNGVDTLVVSKNVTTNNVAEILGGVLSTGTSAFNVTGDLIHNTTHISDAAGPGIVMNGTGEQFLSNSNVGSNTATFGVLEINNPNDVIIPDVGDNYIVSQKLVLNTGVFDIGGTLLTLDTTAVITNGSGASLISSFSRTNMINTNSSPDDNGLRKRFSSTFSGTFVMPVGKKSDPDAGNIYTPFRPNVSSITKTGVAHITVKPITGVTAGLAEDTDENCNPGAPDFSDLDNVLKYHWLLRSANITGFTGIFDFFYDASDFGLDAVATGAGFSVVNFAPARLLDNSNDWDLSYSNNLFIEADQQIRFAATSAGADYSNFPSSSISGSYTAGLTVTPAGDPLCAGAIPPTVPIFETFGTNTTGSYGAAGSYVGGVAPTTAISGDLVVNGNFNLNFDVNNIRFRKVTLTEDAKISITGTVGHRLGLLSGRGTLSLAPSVDDGLVFPNFEPEQAYPEADCSGDGIGLEFAGTTVNYNIPTFATVRRISFVGSGERRLSASESMLVCENLTIGAGTTLKFNNSGNFTFEVKGNVIKNATGILSDANNNSSIWLTSGTAQSIFGDFTGSSAINELRVNKSANRVTISGNVQVKNRLRLNSGIVNVSGGNSLRMNQGSTYGTMNDEFGANSFVNGPLIRQLSETTASDSRIFAVGASGRFGRMSVVGARSYAPSGNKNWTVKYNANGFAYTSLTTAAKTEGIERASENEHWTVDVPSDAIADLQLTWSTGSNVVSTVSNIRMVRWTGSAWDFVPHISGGSPTGSATSGSHTAGEFTFSTVTVTHSTLDSITTPLPVEMLSFTAQAVDGEIVLDWSTASEKDNEYFEVQRSIDGKDFEVIGYVDGFGTTNVQQNYEFLDTKPYVGLSYYRLRQVDYDGQFEFTNIISALLKFDDFAFSVFPNPFLDAFNVEIQGLVPNERTGYRVISLSGGLVDSGEITADDFGRIETAISLTNKARTGMYVLVITAQERTFRFNLLKR